MPRNNGLKLAQIVRTTLLAVSLVMTQHQVANAVCVFGMGDCGPPLPIEEDGKSVLASIIRAKFPGRPFSITEFHKTNGAAVDGGATYQMFYTAQIEFPKGLAEKSPSVWDQLGAAPEAFDRARELVQKGFKVVKGGEVFEPQIFAGNSMFRFQKTEKGWLAEDGKIHPSQFEIDVRTLNNAARK